MKPAKQASNSPNPAAAPREALGARTRALGFALLAALLVFASEQVIEHFARQRLLEQEKRAVLDSLSTLRARLEGEVNANLFLVHGLTAVIAARPNMDQAEFVSIARNLVDERHALRNIGAAPGMVITMMYPLAGNEAALGLDYRTHTEQKQAALRARDSGQAVLAGPLQLRQGGIGFIAREPVFLPPNRPAGERRFWGLVAAVIDAETLYAKAGLRDFAPDLRLAVRGRNGGGAAGPAFFGDAGIFAAQPVTLSVTLPGGSWQIAAIPAKGWGSMVDNIHLIRLMGLLAALAAAVMAYRLARGNQILAEHGARLSALLNTLPDLVWLKDPNGVYLACNPRVEQLYGARESEIVGKADHDFVTPDLADFFREQDRAAIAAGGPRVNEEWLTFASDGHRELAETIKTPVYDHKGKLLGVLGIARDISARRRIETALLESETRLRLFIEHAPAALAMFDREMRYLAVSRRWLSDYNLENRDILGHCHYEIFSDIPQRWKDVHRRGLAGEVIRANEDRFARQDGATQWLRWEVRPWHGADGGIGGIVIFSEDITDYKVAGQALRDSEARFVATFEQAAVGIAMVSPEGHWLRVNRKLCEIVDYTPAEMMSKNFQDITHPDDLDSDLDYVRRMLAREIDSYAMEKRYLRKDGGIVWINLTVALVWKQDGGPDYFISVIEDIDTRKAAEIALQESETRYRSLLEMAPFPAVLTRVSDGVLLYGNHRAELQYGIRREAGIGQNADTFYEDPTDRERFVARMRRDGHVEDLEVRMRSQDGRGFWALLSASIVEFDHEAAIFAAINDISARKQAEAALEAQEAFFRLIAENMVDMVAVLDTEGRRLYNSPSYEALFGATEALKGTDSFAEIHPDDRERVREVFQKTVRAGVGHRMNFRFLLADGGVRDIESQGCVIRGADGAVERVVVVSRDITERKRLEDEIRQLNSELEERVRLRTTELAAANKELETFTYSVSHDLKAPLRGIDGYSRLLLEDYRDRLDEEGRLFLNNVRQGVDQMSQLIEDLLAYSRMERQGMNGQTLDLQRLVSDILNERRAEIEARGVVVELELAGLTARADPDGLAMVLRNLIDNALKFTRDSHPAKLRIHGAAGRDTTTLDIGDNGIGFDMRFHDRIFEIFQRLQRAEDYPGTGIGLAIVRKAMLRMGGRIRAESAPGRGATFHLELPRVDGR